MLHLDLVHLFRKPLTRNLLPCVAAAFAILFPTTLPAAAAQPPNPTPRITIDSSVTIVESADEAAPIHRATQDLIADLTKVFGRAPRLVNRLENAGPLSIVIADRSNLPAGINCATTTDTESFAFSVINHPGATDSKHIVCLTGADMRGTIYAIYQFSQTYLGVDPMYLWTDKQPARRQAIKLPVDFDRVYPKPVFKYRGFFLNDEDLLTGWRPPAKDEQTGISLKTWDNVFETILRLKGNMVVPGTWIFPDDAQVHAAAERGLIINQHHAIPLGVNVARWPKDVPYNFSTHPEILQRAWTNAVATYKPDEEILWSVGLRGLSDTSYASLDPSVRDNDKLLGERVSQAISEQMRIVRARYPHAQFVTDLWQEGARLMHEGYLSIPKEVSLVWADTGYGDMRDGGKVASGQGAYFHVAMLNGNANQLSEMVSVAVIQSELGRYIKADATSYLLLNTSDIRPVAMTTRAVMETAWGGVPHNTGDADGDYYRRWATEEFGAKSADEVSRTFKAYFSAPAGTNIVLPGGASFERVYGDQHYYTEMRRFILDTLSEHQVVDVPSQSPKWTLPRLARPFDAQTKRAALTEDIQQCEAAQPRWDAVWKQAVAAEKLVDLDRRKYYQAEVLTMISINRESNRALLSIAKSIQAADAGHAEKAHSEAKEALHSLDLVQQSMTAAEYGKWKNWYRGDWLDGVYRMRQLVQSYADHLQDPLARLPPPVEWNGWEGYFHIMQYEGDRTADVH